MGYYSTAEFHFRIKPEHIEAIRNILKQRSDKLLDEVDTSLARLKINERGEIEPKEEDSYHEKWYHTDEMANFFGAFSEEGYMMFMGEDGNLWGYEFDGEGNVFIRNVRMERGEKLNEDRRN